MLVTQPILVLRPSLLSAVQYTDTMASIDAVLSKTSKDLEKEMEVS